MTLTSVSYNSDLRAVYMLNACVVGKAAIGTYLWEHILGGTLEQKMGGVWALGKLWPARKDLPRLQLTYRTGPGVQPFKVGHLGHCDPGLNPETELFCSVFGRPWQANNLQKIAVGRAEMCFNHEAGLSASCLLVFIIMPCRCMVTDMRRCPRRPSMSFWS